MKKIIALILFASLLICSLSACKKDEGDNNDAGGEAGGNTGSEQIQNSVEDVLRQVLPGATVFYDISDSDKYPESVTTFIKTDVGYVLVVKSNGYKDGLFVMCGIDNDGKIVGVEIIGDEETPEKSDPVFDAVSGLNGEYAGQGMMSFDPHIVAGATSTSKGVANAIKLAIEIVSDLIIGDGFSIIDEDLSQYIEIDEKYYKDYEVLVDPDRVTEFDIDNEIIKVLCKNKDKTAIESGDGIVSVGDVANIYYRGYYFDEDGGKIYFDGGCNFPSANASGLEIGSGSFIAGFEYNLIGKNKDNFATFSKISEGAVRSDDIILITYTVLRADGTTETSKSAVIDLNDPKIDDVWGSGFGDYFKNNQTNIGTKIESITVGSVKTEGMSDVYTNVTVAEVYRIDKSEERPVLVVEAFFPEGYQAPELAGKVSYFEVFITGLTEYNAPELTDAFITDTLKLADTLADYEGDTLIKKYREYMREVYMNENGLDVDSLIQDAFWKSVMAGGVVKKYPEIAVLEIYYSYLSELEYYYQSYSYYYGYDDFMCLYIGLEVGSDWRGTLREMAEGQLKQELIFYGIMQKEGLTPTKAEYDARFDEYLAEALEKSGITPDKYHNTAQYESEKERYRQQILESKGEDYFRTMIYYQVTLEAIKGYAKVIEG